MADVICPACGRRNHAVDKPTGEGIDCAYCGKPLSSAPAGADSPGAPNPQSDPSLRNHGTIRPVSDPPSRSGGTPRPQSDPAYRSDGAPQPENDRPYWTGDMPKFGSVPPYQTDSARQPPNAPATRTGKTPEPNGDPYDQITGATYRLGPSPFGSPTGTPAHQPPAEQPRAGPAPFKFAIGAKKASLPKELISGQSPVGIVLGMLLVGGLVLGISYVYCYFKTQSMITDLRLEAYTLNSEVKKLIGRSLDYEFDLERIKDVVLKWAEKTGVEADPDQIQVFREAVTDEKTYAEMAPYYREAGITPKLPTLLGMNIIVYGFEGRFSACYGMYRKEFIEKQYTWFAF